MKVISARNIQQALPEMVRLIKTHGVKRDSRFGPVLVAPWPVATVYQRPLERVEFWPARDSNPIFHLMEALWMLNGGRDVAFPTMFNSSFAQFSDDGVTFNAAYGHRWRRQFGLDQLRLIAEKLRINPDDRRQVLTMWDPRNDLHQQQTKDLPCLAGDTVLWSPEGDRQISEVAALFASGEISRWPVYSVNPDTKEMSLKWCTKVWCSGLKQTKRLTFDDGSSIRLTEDHVLYRRGRRAIDAVPVKVSELAVGDRLLATARFASPKGHETVKRHLGCNTSFSNMHPTHRAYWELVHGEIPAGHVIHHEDENKLNNSLKNLRCLTESEHNRIHRLGDKNPMRRLTPEQHKARALKQGAALKATWARKKSQVDNHRIVKIEDGLMEPVYDFTVPETHTALIGTGIVAHNCNTHVYLQRGVEGELNMTVCCRSNDLVWGLGGANAVHFPFLMEYMAGCIGCPVGTYTHLSNNFHAYLKTLEKVEALADVANSADLSGTPDPYAQGVVEPFPLFTGVTPDEFDRELSIFIEQRGVPPMGGKSAFLKHVAAPIALSNMIFRTTEALNRREQARDQATECRASDWRTAAVAWYERRILAAQKEKTT